MAGGRPTKYKEDYNEKAFIACAELGADDKTLAKLFDVNVSNLNEWKKKYDDFRESIKKGKDIFDTEKVEKSLLQRALGYTYTETKTEVTKNKAGKVTRTKVTTFTKHMAPDPTCKIFWLKNRNKDRWKDIKAVASTDSEGKDKEYPTLEDWLKKNATEG